MVFLGMVTALLEDVFAGQESGPGGQAIFLATFVYFLNGIGTSGELLFGGIVQNMVASVIILSWAKARSSARKVPGLELAPTASYRSLTQ